MKVLYIIGKGRSGSTLLDNLLGQLDGFFSGGELMRLWSWGLVEGYACGCGLPVRDCRMWRSVMDTFAALMGDEEWSPERLVELERKVVGWRHGIRLLRRRPGGRSGWPSLDAYTLAMSRLYLAIAKVSGARVVVDSSKLPIHPTALGLVPDTDVYLVHLVRDPRAVVRSWKRRKEWTDRQDQSEMPRYGVAYSMASWMARNLVAEVVKGRTERGHSMLVRYEDFVARPREALQEIARLVGEEAGRLPFLADRSVRLDPTHTVGGNPARLETGRVEVVADEEWRLGLSRTDLWLATLLGLPLLRRYGYGVGTSGR